jgi:DNA-binding NtrC family response regulator
MTPQSARKADVVLLEDDALINMSTSALIEDMGYRVRSFMHLADCKRAVEDRLPDLAVFDVNLTGETSYELAHWLDERRVPVIFLTGYDSPEADARLQQRPTCRKPCDPETLKKLIAAALKSGRPATKQA